MSKPWPYNQIREPRPEECGYNAIPTENAECSVRKPTLEELVSRITPDNQHSAERGDVPPPALPDGRKGFLEDGIWISDQELLAEEISGCSQLLRDYIRHLEANEDPLDRAEFFAATPTPAQPTEYEASDTKQISSPCKNCGKQWAEHHVVCDLTAPVSVPPRGDGFCEGCGRKNDAVWYAPNAIWNSIENLNVLCIECFIKKADDQKIGTGVWRLTPDGWVPPEKCICKTPTRSWNPDYILCLTCEGQIEQQTENQSSASAEGASEDAQSEVSTKSQPSTSERTQDSREALTGSVETPPPAPSQPSGEIRMDRIYCSFFEQGAYEIILWAKGVPDNDESVAHLAANLKRIFSDPRALRELEASRVATEAGKPAHGHSQNCKCGGSGMVSVAGGWAGYGDEVCDGKESAYIRYLGEASKEVASWPEWKKPGWNPDKHPSSDTRPEAAGLSAEDALRELLNNTYCACHGSPCSRCVIAIEEARKKLGCTCNRIGRNIACPLHGDDI